MQSILAKQFTSDEKLTSVLAGLKINTLNDLFSYIRNLPYGRNSDRSDPELVLTEQKGTCSSKHAFVKLVAIENKADDVQLMIGMYRMQNKNTAAIGDILEKNGLEYLPEAHCYLKINDERIDLTFKNSDFNRIKNDLIEEVEILPWQTAAFKITYHQNFLKHWLRKEKIQFTFDEIWKIREQCIQSLSVE